MSSDVRRCTEPHDPDWLALRLVLWPDTPVAKHQEEMATFCNASNRFAQFIARDANGLAAGFVEIALRSDYVNGTDASPVAFLEGIFVRSAFRRRGVARTLVAAAEKWALSLGCNEFASDAAIDNTASHSLHNALGFTETERVVFFRKSLADQGSDTAFSHKAL